MFLTSADLRAGPGPTDDFWYSSVGVDASGRLRSPDAALRQSVVYACVALLSQSVAKIPTRVMSGVATVVKDHPVTQRLSRRPNRWQTAFEFKEMLQAHLCLRSHAYSQIIFGRAGEIAELVPMHPDRVRIEQISDMDVLYIVKDWRGAERRLLSDEVWHLRGMSLDGFQGLAAVSAGAEVIETGLNSQGYRAKSFKNGARHSGMWIEHPSKFDSDEAAKKFRDAFRAAMSGENAYSTPVMDRGMKIHELGMTNQDAQLVESSKLSESELCRLWLVPPHKVGILDRATNNNIEQQNEQFYSDTLMALFRRWEESAEVHLLTEEEQADLRIEFDVAQLLRADVTARSKMYHDGIQDGWLVRNEVRQREGLEPLDGLDEPLEPLNMVQPGSRGQPAEGAPDKPDGNADDKPQAILLAAADRAVRREVNALRRIRPGPAAKVEAADFYGKHATWLAPVLAIEQSVADRICEARFDQLVAGDLRVIDDFAADGGAGLLDLMKGMQ